LPKGIYKNKKVISPNSANFFACKHIFGVCATFGCTGAFSRKEGAIQALAGLSSLSQTVGS